MQNTFNYKGFLIPSKKKNKNKKKRECDRLKNHRKTERERARADHQITNDQHTQKREKYKTVY